MTTPRLTALWAGIVLLAIGALGVFFGGSGSLFGIFPITLWLSIAYIVTGLVLAVASTDEVFTHNTSLIVGPVYGVLGLLGLFIRSFNPLGVFPIHGVNVALFLVLGFVMLYDWLSTPSRQNLTSAH